MTRIDELVWPRKCRSLSIRVILSENIHRRPTSQVWNTQAISYTSSAQLTRTSLTFSIDKDFPVPGQPQTYKLPAFSFSTACLQNSRTLFCSTCRHTRFDGALDTCNASFTAFNCSISMDRDGN